MSNKEESEYQEWIESYRRQLLREKEEKLNSKKEVISSFKEHCLSKDIALNDCDFDYIPTIGVIAKYPNILTKLNPALLPDKEGLVDCNTLFNLYEKKKFNPGYLYGDDYIAMVSPVFRRGMHGVNNWAPRFVDKLWNIEDPSIDSYISLDYDRVRINVDDSCYFEFDTWYGAPFDQDISSIKDSPTNLRPPLDIQKELVSFFFNNAYALDIIWSTKGNIKSFQALEFKDESIKIDINNIEYYPARYIHAEYDLSNSVFRHFDGAIQYYNEKEYFERRDSNFNHNVKKSSKIKAMSVKTFKFNGKITLTMWTEFCSHFLTGNPLIFEYFSGSYPNYILDALEKLRVNAGKNI